MERRRRHVVVRGLKLTSIVVCLPFYLLAQKEYRQDIPENLRHYTLLVENIPLKYLESNLNERDSAAIAEEFSKIEYIQNMYLVTKPTFRCLLVEPGHTDSLVQLNPKKYRYVLKYKVTEKKINKVYEEVISFYFHDALKGSDLDLLGERNYNTKATLVLIYARIRKMYSTPVQ
ncbi:MAG TPA: hypothetical protein EYN71_11945 [Flavobacteriales bacterium]|nr:hypothetical protein [Flavobacteriales bacterium]